MTAYLDSTALGRHPSTAEWQDHLREFHRTFADVTSFPMSLLRTPAGETSYVRLAACVHERASGAMDILDVGCGDGTLLAELRAAYGSGARLSGIDLSEPEIDRAHARLPKAALIAGDFLSESYPAQSFDVVTGHLSFGLIPRTGELFAKCAAILRTGGALALVTEDSSSGGSLVQAFGIAMAAVRRRHAAFAPLIPNRESIEDDAVLREQLRKAGFSEMPFVERFSVHASVTNRELWELVRRAYPFGLLSPQIQAEAATAVAEFAGEGSYDAQLTLRLTFVRR